MMYEPEIYLRLYSYTMIISIIQRILYSYTMSKQ